MIGDHMSLQFTLPIMRFRADVAYLWLGDFPLVLSGYGSQHT